MRLDLMQLNRMHPGIPLSTAMEYGYRAALGLERHRHEPGVEMATSIEGEAQEASLHWVRTTGGAEQLDRDRITEDAAEAITLVLVHVARGWKVVRRLQRGEFADWLLEDDEASTIALEVSGIAEGNHAQRLREKIEQVGHAIAGDQRFACVVELAMPRATMQRA